MSFPPRDFGISHFLKVFCSNVIMSAKKVLTSCEQFVRTHLHFRTKIFSLFFELAYMYTYFFVKN